MNFARFRTFLPALFILIVVSFPSSVHFCQSKGGQWTFEGNGTDIASWDGAENNGALSGGAAYSSIPAPPESGSCLWLDPGISHDCFLVPHGADLDFNDETFGFSAWVYPMVLNDVHFIINKGDQFTNPKTTNYAVRISKSRNLEFLIRDRNNQAKTVASRFLIQAGVWTFIAVFYDFPSGKVYMWNQQIQAAADTLSFAESFFANTDPLTIGSWYSSDPSSPTSKDFEGGLDDVRVSGRLDDILPASSAVDGETGGRASRKTVLKLFPNPVVAQASPVTILIERTRPEPGTVRVVDILGRTVFSRSVNPSVISEKWVWDGQGAPGGLYLVVLDSPSGRVVEKLRMVR